jgi:hypothetical protein
MRSPDTDKSRAVAVRIASQMDGAEKQALARWIESLIEIRNCGLPVLQKARRAVSLSASSRVIVAAVKIVGREIKRHGWDNRTGPVRLGLGAAAVAAVAFGGQNAGIAALGAAVGVPLWVVFGAGVAFAGVLYEEITGRRLDTKATYRVMDAEKVDE